MAPFIGEPLSACSANTTVYDLPPKRSPKQPGRPRKYGERLGSASDLACQYRDRARSVSVALYGKQRSVMAYDRIVMLKNRRRRVRVLWVFRHNRWGTFFSTDLDLSAEQIIEIYGARWKIGVSREGHMNLVGESPTEVRSSSLVAWEAPWREIKTVRLSDIMLPRSMRNVPGCNDSERRRSLVTRKSGGRDGR